jgi:predicted nucleic acid-binding protein
VNLVDSCGWLEYFADGPNARFFASPVEDVKHLLVPSICVLEVFKRVLLQRGEDAALQAVALMLQGVTVDLNAPIAVAAAKISFERNLPLADSVILATARHYHAIVWTQDADFLGIDGVRYVEKK